MELIDGIIFLFSLDKEETLNSIEEEINYFHNKIQLALFAKGKRVREAIIAARIHSSWKQIRPPPVDLRLDQPAREGEG